MEKPIAERIFYLDGDTKDKPAVVFRFWKPYQPSEDYPRCAYELATAEKVQRGEVSGVDAIDCIIMCLSQAGSKIAGLNESVFRGRLRWEAWPEGGPGLGLPTIEEHWPMREGYEGALRWVQDQK